MNGGTSYDEDDEDDEDDEEEDDDSGSSDEGEVQDELSSIIPHDETQEGNSAREEDDIRKLDVIENVSDDGEGREDIVGSDPDR